MSEEHSQFPSPNRLIHEPARLAILTVLSSCVSADFVFLQGVTGLSKGNLSVQLSNLEHSGLVAISKEIVDKKTRTTARLSELGATEWSNTGEPWNEIRARMAGKEKQTRPTENEMSPAPG